ncbi:EthD domain-containing protein [uncultured Sphingomonas sp.]|uniref:EthD domain-containing protein n=1 Tax=uncultured Sphingomonas sp. TaxID=158754 RepID=UPI0035CA8752
MNDSNDPSRRLVVASLAIAGTIAAAPALSRTATGAAPRKTKPMIKMIITIKRRVGMSHDEFVRYQRDVHRPLLMAIPETRRYIRRFVVSYPVSAPDYSGPDYDSVVEGWFDSMEDMNALYFSENFLKKVDPDHVNFMDLSSYGRVVTEEEVVIG